MPRRLSTIALVLALAAGGLSCAASKAQKRTYMDRNMDFGAVKTVAVLPFSNLARDTLAGERVRDVFATMLLATNAFYVLPGGEVVRGIGIAGVANPVAPSVEEVMKLGKTLKADAIFTGTVKEYGEVRQGAAAANTISLSVQLQETATGRVVWAGQTTKGGVTLSGRLLGSGGEPLNDVTEAAVDDLLDQLFK
ncbi:MAG: DUF799 family lipoprotein [Anaeromyxobacteraceae bacterium]